MAVIHVESLSQEVAKRIREMIRKGDLRKGDKIVEKPLCDTLGVSRTPLREALRLLSAEGFIELIPNKGAFVSEPSMDEIREMFWVMSILEATCARLCAEKSSQEGLNKLAALYRKLEKHARDRDHEKYMAVNHRYHLLVQEFAGSKVLSEVINGLRQKILLYRYRQIYEPNRLDASMREHRALHEAFVDKDPDAAERLMKEHLLRQSEVLEGAHADSSHATSVG